MYFLVRYARMLEEGEFSRDRASFLLLLITSATLILLTAQALNLTFLGSSLTFCTLYVWGRRNSDVEMQMFGVLNFRAPYLPLVMLGFSLVLGNSATVDLLGIAAGHVFYFGRYVYPRVAEIRGWKRKDIMQPPDILRWICGDLVQGND
jgi:Derlin-2/3